MRTVLLLAGTLTLAACGGSEHLSFLNPQGPVASAQMAHFYWVLGIMAVFVAGPIFLVLPFLLWRYRYGNRAARYTPKWKDHTLISVMTWTGPVLIVCALGFFVWRDSHRLDPYRAIASSEPALQVQVIGYDWKWLIIYPEQHIATIGSFAMPVGRPVTMHLTSATVMKSFFIPALGSQIYAMGGMVSQLNLEASHAGQFLGEDTMYDGNGFHDEKFTAVAMSPDAFRAWVRKVQMTGVPLDDGILKLISRRTTREQMVTSLPRAAVQGGDVVYLRGVTASLFPRVVHSMMDDGSPLVPVAREPTGGSPGHAATAVKKRP